MEKGALLPLRFYPAASWTDYEKIKNYGGDVVILKEHTLFAPAFQLTLPDVGMHWGITDFTTIDAVNYDDGTITDILASVNYDPVVLSKAGEFRSLINYRFPTAGLTEGKYYYHVSDGQTDWYSEVFMICDLSLNALSAAFGNDANWTQFITNYVSASELINTNFCKTGTGAGNATAYTLVDVFLEEEMDLYISTRAYSGPACGATDWNSPIFLELRDASGLVLSDVFTLDTTGTNYIFDLTAYAGGSLRLYMWMDDADTGKGGFELWLQRRYSANNVQLRYSHSTNFCKIFYEDDYENIFFLDSKQVIDENTVEETVVEDDETNKYRIIGTNKEHNSLQFVSGEAMLNAMSLLRLHDNIKIVKETGEVMDVVELIIEQSVIDYEAAQIKLVYREDSCSVEACGFDSCCPTIETPTMEEVYDAPASLPVAGAGNNGDYAMVLTAADQYRIYLSNGAAWAVDTTFDIANNCVEARQNNHTNGNRFFWYDSGASRWRIFIELAAVADATGGIATLTTDTEYRDAVTVRGEYYDTTDEQWTACTEPTLLVAGGGAIALSCESGAGVSINFRLHIYDDSCDYGYSNEVTQTIT